MANLKTVQIPAEVKLQVTNQAQVMRNLYKDFQDIFASVDPGSMFGKSIAKAFSKVESKLSASEGLLSNEFFSEADLQKVASQLSSISELFGQINIQARGVSANTLGLDTTEIENAEKHLKQLQERVRELKGAKVGALLGADSKDLQEFAKLSKTTGFSGGKSYTENYKSMETAVGRITEKYSQLTIEAQEAEEALRQANEETAKARVSLNIAEGQLANRKQANMDVASQIMGVKVSGKGATRDSITEQYLSMLDAQLDQGQWVAGGENFAHIIAGWLEVDEADLAGTATDIVNNLKNAIRTAMAGGPIASNKLRASAKSVLGGEEAALRKDAGYVELEQKAQTSATYVQGAEIAAAEALSTLQAANNNVEQTRQLLEEIQTQMARLKELQDEYNAAVDIQHREQIDAARQGVNTAKSNTKAGILNASEKDSKAAGRTAQGTQENFARIQAIRQAAEAQAKADAIAAKESQEFTANLKQSISHWMSAQQVINMVKQGIRQAYQDIQGLDSAMTNIAVVTDMSVSDLWGKINDYMGIAQQYGVTTQGVYEVSQLYYQQGLSTNEVMEATTETLKMARIAGMGYAEAADAMTVAIRAFKMEMSDAGHVTDVYSKIAAVTASDTEELAIAMSKTASSAESVGSSFENTTAMLAVMIETTRESAQNLGSALKSIISRYGEMKQGLTQDSDGEIIDYNKTDAALRSIGISIKDAQGQFRDFDDVIFELSSKWDSLDKNTQRYIATIMAGNRQQSRFIALVDNWERLDEVASSAQDSEDAGLLQYAKTLDSLESKLNNLKTSFQQFYMSIFNGEFFKGAVDIINNFVQSLTRMGPVLGSINLLQLINQIKLVGQLLINTFSKSIQKVRNANKAWQDAFTGGWTPVGEKIANALAEAILNKATLVGKEFVRKAEDGAEQAATNPSQPSTQAPQESSQATIQQQVYSSKVLGKASQVLHTWSPLSASVLGEYGVVQDRPSMLGNPDKINEAYQKQADIILASGDKFGESAKKWAEAVKAAGEKFGKDIDETAKREGLKELNTADLEAQKELAAVEQEIAKRKAAETRQQVGSGAMVVGTALTSAGMLINQATMQGYDTSTALQGAGGALSAIGQAATGNYVGALITAVSSVITVFQRFSQRAEIELENAKKASESANIERAESKNTYINLQSLLKQYESAQANRYNDDESYQNWLDINNQLVEAYPELLGYIDAEGNAIADITSKTEILSYYMQKAAEASKSYYDAKIAETTQRIRVNRDHQFSNASVSVFSDNVLNPFAENYQDIMAIIRETFPYQTITGMDRSSAITSENLVKFADEKGYNFQKALSQIQMNGKGYDAFADFLYNYGVIVKNGSGNFEFEQHFSDYLTGYADYQNLNSYSKGGAMSNIRLLLSNEERDNLFDSIEGYESLMYTYATIVKGKEKDILRYMTAGSDTWNSLIEEYTGLYNNFSESQQQIVSSLFNNLGNYSLLDVQEILKNDLKLLSEDHGLYKTFTAQWYERNYNQLANWTERYSNISGIDYSIKDEDSAFSKGLDIYNWIQRKAEITEDSTTYSLDNIDNLYDNYYTELEDALGENDPFFKFIKQHGDATINAYLDYLADEKKLIATHGDGYSIAQSREVWMQQIITDSTNAENVLGSILTENEEARNEFWAMIFTDVGTYDWANNVSAWGEKYNYIGFANAEKYAYENYVVRLQTIIDSTSAAVESLNELAKKQSSGFTWEESQKFLKQLQELDPSQSWHKLFEVNEQGLIVLKDFAQTADMLYLNSIKTLQQETAKSQKIFETLRPQIEYNSREGKNFDTFMGMDTVFALTNSVLHGEGIDGTSFTEETYAELEHLIATGEIINTFDLIEWYNNLPEEKRFAGILKQEKDWIEEAFEKGGLIDNSEESYDRALELAQTINKAYELNFDESSQEFQTLVNQIRAGQITSVETLLSFYQNIANQADAANDVFAKQARLLLANTSFTSWSESFTKGNNVKNLASITNGAYTDLQSLWVQRLEQDWQSVMGENQPRYEIGDQVLENGEIITLDLQHTDKIDQIKTIDNWDSLDYAAYYDAQARALVEHGAKLDAFGNLIITDWEKWASYIADSYGYTEEAAKADPAIKEARDQIFVSARAAQVQLEESATKNIQTGLEELYTSAIEDQELSWDSISNIIQAANLDSETQNEVLNAYEAAKHQGVTGYIAFIDYLTKIIQSGSNGNELDIAALNAAKRDAQNGLISSLASSLNQGLEGTLTNADFNALIEQIGGVPEDYRQYVTETYEGLEISAEGALVIASKLIDEFGNASLVAESLFSQFGETGTLGTYEEVSNLIEQIDKGTVLWAKDNETVLKLLRQIQAQYMLLESDKQFDFMNYDPMQGGANNWKTFTDNVSSAMDVLKTAFESGEKIDYTQISSIISWLGSQGVNALGEANVSLEKFNEAILGTMDALGQVDLSAAAANLGISMSDMTGAFDTGIDKIAQAQIDYWRKYKEFLEGIKTLQEASEGLQIEPPKLADDGKSWNFNGDSFDNQIEAYEEYINYLYNRIEETGKEYLTGENNPIAQLFGNFMQNGEFQLNETFDIASSSEQIASILSLLTSDTFDWIENASSLMDSNYEIVWPLLISSVPKVTLDSENGDNNSGDSSVGEEISTNTEDQISQFLESLGAEKVDDKTYAFTKDGLKVLLDISSGDISFTFAEGTIVPDPEAINKILQAAGYLTENGITFKTNNFSVTFLPTTGAVEGDYSNITGNETTTEQNLLSKLGITKNESGIIFNTSKFTVKIVPNTGSSVEADLSGVTGQKPSEEDLFTKVGITKSKDGSFYSFTGIDGTVYNFTVGPTGVAVFDGGKISTDQVSTDALVLAILAKALSGWSNTGTDAEESYTYNDKSNGTYTYKANGTSSYDISGISVNTTDLAKKIEEQNLDGWTGDSINGYTYKGKTATFIYNASGKMDIIPSKTDGETPTIGDLLAKNFSSDIYTITGNESDGWKVAAKDGTTLFTIPAGVTLKPGTDQGIEINEGIISGLTADADVRLTPKTEAIDDALAKYNEQPIKISLELTNSKNSLLNSPAYNDIIAKTRAYLDKNLSYDEMQAAYYQAYNAFSPYIPSMSREDLLALQQLQSNIDFGLFINENIEDPWWTALGEEASAALEALPEEGELTGITSLFNSLSGENLAANLLGITSLFSTLVSPELATLDLTNFIAQLQSLGELELDDEEIEKLTVIALALTEALTPLANATVNPVITIDNTQAISAINEIKKALDSLPETKTITIDQRLGLLPLKTQLYTRNVNGIAYAEGNFNKLISGAHLANKTLVGELGPELAVYNNQYHLLGRDGAEFVNLPSDAIVFNHRQTEGIIKGQTGYRGKALVNGNVSGPAAAGGIDAAIAAVDNIIALWSNLLDQSVSDLLANSGGGGGGGGNELKAVTAELQEWYNLTRRIAYEEQEINNLIAERNNILDGGDYLKNLRETEKHLKSQRVLQSQLLDYQTQQLQRQADFINDHDIWSKYLYIDENGLLQYINGNETNGGKGALEILESFNKMSGEEQQKYLKSVNYSFTDQDGKDLEGSELAEKFLEQLQAQIDQYDELYDTVHSTEETIEGINSNIKEINEEIKQNQMDLEQAIYEIIESAWEKEIEQLEKQVELIEEANNAYIKGLQDALNAEKEAYSDNQSIEEREALQRQLSLLRRSGGSASEIADLEKQLDDTLKDEYFRNQEKMIENIEEANENQIKLLEKQITLQEEALAFEKENGVLWTKVYEVMSRSEAEILEFMQGNHTDFFSQSLLQQEEMLTDWAKKIGIYSEDRQYQNHIDTATSIWNSQGFWNSNTLKGLQNTYNQLSSEGQSDLRDIFSTTYAQEIMAGSDVDNARLKAEEEVKTYLNKYQKENSSQNTESSGNNSGNSGLNYSKLYYGGYTKNHTFIGGENCYADGLAKAKELARGKGIEVDKGNDWFRTGSSPVKAWRKWYVAKGDKKLTQDYSTKSQAENARISGISGNYNNYVNAQRSGADAATVAKLKQIYEDFNSSDIKFFSTGGLVDYTGLAMVHGSKSKPEGFLNAEQTAQIKEALSITSGKENLLSNLRTTVDKLRSLIHNISTIDNSNNYEINIAPGAVAIQVAQIADSYDIEELSNDVMNRMVAIASKTTNRGVNRR